MAKIMLLTWQRIYIGHWVTSSKLNLWCPGAKVWLVPSNPQEKKTQKPCFQVGYSWIMLDLYPIYLIMLLVHAVDLWIYSSWGPRKTSMDDFKPWKSSQIACARSTSMACLQAGRFCSAKLASTCRHSGSWLPRSFNSWPDPMPKFIWSRWRLDQQRWRYETLRGMVINPLELWSGEKSSFAPTKTYNWHLAWCGDAGCRRGSLLSEQRTHICQVTDRCPMRHLSIPGAAGNNPRKSLQKAD